MATRGSRSARPGVLIDQRRSADRRKAPREGLDARQGRRSTDSADGQSVSATEESGGRSRKRRATRDGREPLVIYLRPESIKALKMAALERDTTASAIVAEAIDAWFRANGRLPRR